ncbi:MAG TPA: DUF2835 family protein [Sedimenticola thiotaurini]|uniref:DUF2835 family protein n=1 Tax=Sedimenticola thiotaurini TaxID=1543721 RepID=A0A831RQ27_9GAMM|nr:DUF2835 family protein [Sedimenticola thiotaurini]
MQRIRFRIDLPPERFVRYYQGVAQAVVVQAEDGRNIQLPAVNLRPFVTGEGVRGRFQLTLDDDGRLLQIDRIG